MTTLALTPREMDLVMSWRKEPFWPDDERILRKLRAAREQGEAPGLTRLQLGLVLEWAEEQVGGHYGVPVANPDEQVILRKLREALAST
ncbi:MAG: hypothetical protein ABIL09_14850 [Gemmatimonadota bacterium]